MGLARRAAIATLLACAACGEEGPADPEVVTAVEALVDHDAWTPVDAADDPLADHRPDSVECGPAGAYPEGADFEVDTANCNYYAGSQPSLHAVEAGRVVEIGLRHFDLAAPEAATAHVAVLFGDTLVWEEHIDIAAGPTGAPANVYELAFESPIDLEAGAPVHLHLHNHGQNTWALRRIDGEVVQD